MRSGSRTLEEHPLSGFGVVLLAIAVTATILWFGHATVRGCDSDEQPVPVTMDLPAASR